jgi:membrane protease YdiL (CAAX protease family)
MEEQAPRQGVIRRLWHCLWPPLLYFAVINAMAFIATIVIVVTQMLSRADIMDIVNNEELYNTVLNDAMEAVFYHSSLISCCAAAVGLVIFLPLFFRERKRCGEDGVKADNETFSLSALLLPCSAGMNILTGYLLVLIFALLPALESDYGDLVDAMTFGPPYMVFLYAVVFAPVVEEVINRGLVQGRVRRWLGPRPAIVISALVFALSHISLFAPGTYVQGLYAFILGIFLAWVYERRRHILVPIAAHVGFNFSNYLLVLIPESAPDILVFFGGAAIAVGFLAMFALRTRNECAEL